MQAELQHNLQPAVHQPNQMPAPSLTARSAAPVTAISTLPPALCQGQDGSAAYVLPFGEHFMAEPSSAEASKGGEASKAQQSSAAAFLDDILAQSNSGRLFKGRAHMHRLAGTTSFDAQPADDLLDRHVSVAKLTGHHHHVCIDAVVPRSAQLAPLSLGVFHALGVQGLTAASAIDCAPSHLNISPEVKLRNMVVPMPASVEVTCQEYLCYHHNGCPF